MARIKKGEKRSKATQQNDVLLAFEQYANVTIACKKAKVPRRTFYNWLEETEFNNKFQSKVNVAIGVLEDEANRRAVQGTTKPVFYKGKRCGSIREYSDTLLIVLLKAHAPDKYKDRVVQEVTGKNGKKLELDLSLSNIANIPTEQLLEHLSNPK